MTIEKIAREWAERAGPHCEYEGDFAADLAADIRGLLTSTASYRAGAEDMQEKAAAVAEHRHKNWRLPHPDDAKPGEVCDDISACRDIATAIRSLPLPDPQPTPTQESA